MNCNIKDFGAVSGGRICTKEIQSAIDACFLTGKVYFDSGLWYNLSPNDT